MICLSKRERRILILAIVLVFSAISYNLIFEPWLHRWNEINQQIYLKEAGFKKGIRLLENSGNIVKKYSYYSSSFKDISGLLNYIEAQASASDIKTANIKPSPLLQAKFYKEYEIELQVEGEARDIQVFIYSLVKLPAGMCLKKFNFNGQPEDLAYLKGTLTLSALII